MTSRFGERSLGSDVVKTFGASLEGKIVLITGPSIGTIGGQVAIDLAQTKMKTILLAGRSHEKIQPVIDRINEVNPAIVAKFISLDLSSQDSVRAAAKSIRDQVDKLDLVINNAGIMALEKYTTSKEGIELQFATNHIGHFLLTNLLIDKIIAAAPNARIINVTSLGYMLGPIRYDDYNFENGSAYNPWLAYAQSKTANMLFTKQLTDMYRKIGILSFAVNPGLVLESNPMKDVSEKSFGEGMKLTKSILEEGEEMPSLQPKPLEASSATTLYTALNPDIKGKSFDLFDIKVFDTLKQLRRSVRHILERLSARQEDQEARRRKRESEDDLGA